MCRQCGWGSVGQPPNGIWLGGKDNAEYRCRGAAGAIRKGVGLGFSGTVVKSPNLFAAQAGDVFCV